MAADRPYGEFYDFHSVSPEYFGYHCCTGKATARFYVLLSHMALLALRPLLKALAWEFEVNYF
jgi:hypothetical protein